MEKDEIFLSQEVLSWINENNKQARKKEEKERIKVEEYCKKKEKKEKIEKRIINLISLAIVIAGLRIGVPLAVDAVKNEVALYQANKYMDTAIDFVAKDLDRAVLSDGTVVLFSNDAESLKAIADELQTEFGLSRDCAIYCISEKYGSEAFDRVVTAYGYKNSDDFLFQLYPKNIDNYKEGDYKSFENNVQVELVDKVELIKDLIESKNNQVRGLK